MVTSGTNTCVSGRIESARSIPRPAENQAMADHNHKLEWRNERIVNTDAWREACRCIYCHEEFVPASKLQQREQLLATIEAAHTDLLAERDSLLLRLDLSRDVVQQQGDELLSVVKAFKERGWHNVDSVKQVGSMLDALYRQHDGFRATIKELESRLEHCQLALAKLTAYTGHLHREQGSPRADVGLLVMSEAHERMGEELWSRTLPGGDLHVGRVVERRETK